MAVGGLTVGQQGGVLRVEEDAQVVGGGAICVRMGSMQRCCEHLLQPPGLLREAAEIVRQYGNERHKCGTNVAQMWQTFAT